MVAVGDCCSSDRVTFSLRKKNISPSSSYFRDAVTVEEEVSVSLGQDTAEQEVGITRNDEGSAIRFPL